MAKREEARPAKSKMTVMVFQLEGNDDTIQEGLRKISQAVENTFQGPKGYRQLTSAPGKASAEASIVDDLSIQDEDVPAVDDSSDEQSESSAEVRPKTRKAERAPDVVEIDRSKATVTLQDFFAQKLPGESTQGNQILVIAYWLKRHAKISEFNVDHMYTLMREMEKSMGTFPRTLLRNMKTRRLLSGGSAEGMYTTNSVSESKVDRMPGK